MKTLSQNLWYKLILIAVFSYVVIKGIITQSFLGGTKNQPGDYVENGIDALIMLIMLAVAILCVRHIIELLKSKEEKDRTLNIVYYIACLGFACFMALEKIYQVF